MRGKGKGEIRSLSAEGAGPAAVLRFGGSEDWTAVTGALDTGVLRGTSEQESLEKMPLLIQYMGRGKIDLKSFTLG